MKNTRPPASYTCRAMTLVEIMVAAAVFSVALVIAMLSATMANRSASNGIQYSQVSTIATNALSRMTEDLADARFDSLYMDRPDGDCEIYFEKVTGYDSATGQSLVTSICYRWECAERGDATLLAPVPAGDNIDNDGDGETDQGRIVRVNGVLGAPPVGEPDGHRDWADTPGTEVVIIDGIAKNGLWMVKEGSGVDITVRPYYLMRSSGEPRVITEFNTIITCRN